MSAVLLLQVATLSLLPLQPLTFSGSPPDSCKYQGYKFQLLKTHVCVNYRLCYCQVDPAGFDSANPTFPPQIKHPGNYLEYNADSGESYTESSGTTTPPLSSPQPYTTEVRPGINSGAVFRLWRPKPPHCACWCSGIMYENLDPNVLYKPDDTCIIDETDCYCDLEKDLLWANQQRHIYE